MVHPEDAIDPASARTKEDLAALLKKLRLKAGNPAYRDLEKRALAMGRALSRTTLSEVLNGKRFPTKVFLLTLVEFCGVDPETDPRWEQAWYRLALQYTSDHRAAGSRPEAHSGLVRQVARTWQEAADQLAADGRQELAERGLREMLDLQEAFLGAADPVTLATRHKLALIVGAQGRYAQAERILDGAGGERAGLLDAGRPGPVWSATGESAGEPGAAASSAQTAAGEAVPGGGRSPGRPRSGVLPQIWNVEPPNAEFTGREAILAGVRRRMATGEAPVQVLRGPGGVGKTQIAIEYAHRFAAHYELVWWIAAEDPALIGEQISALATALELVETGAESATAASVVKAHLRGRENWLLIFDNAEQPAALREWLPGGPGHVLITSRTGGWGHVATAVTVEVMARAESVQLLRTHYSSLDRPGAERLAEALGDLPLALAQAGGFLAETATTVDDYLNLLHDHPYLVLLEGSAGDYPHPLAGAIGLSTDRLAEIDTVGLTLLRLCAFLAPELVPTQWLVGAQHAAGPLDELRHAAGNPVALRRGIASIGRLGLATTSPDGVRLHRLVQSIIRDRLPAQEQQMIREHARIVLVGNDPGDPEDPRTWPGWARMMPHLLAVEPQLLSTPELRELACNAAWYLIERGDADAAARLARDLYHQWRDDYGPDAYHTLLAARDLARAMREQGQYQQARKLYEDAVPRSQHAFPDHPTTLRLMHGFAIALYLLGDYQQAHDLQQESWMKYRRIQGDDHPHTLHSANHLATARYALGRHEDARELHQDTLTRYERVLGDNHPDTLRCANNLAIDLRALGQTGRARQLQENTLARRRRVLGNDHPYTLQSVTSLAETLCAMERYSEARDLLQEVLARYAEVLGGGHPETLHAAEILAGALDALGEDARAVHLREDITRRRPGTS